MVTKGALLRNIRPSGGLFTENILLRLRDNPTQLKIGKIETFNVSSKKELDKKQTEIFEWCKQKWDEISPNIDSWKLEELIEKWLIPFLAQLDHELEKFEVNEHNIDEDSPIKDFQITHQSKDHKNPFFHFINISEEFDSKTYSDPQGKSHHNICQQFINLNSTIEWLVISNGRILRLLTKYFHIYSKGYLEFDIENILANRDLIEFNALYSTLHSSRFIAESEDQESLINLFQKDSITEGIKIGDALRDKVHDAIELLGDELIQQNSNFLEKVIINEIDPQEFYAELLRIIYRIIFILYAEQRKMLPGAGSIYFEQLSLSSLRFLAEKPIKAEKNTDIWNKLFLTFKLINEGNEFLSINSYNGSLFKNKNLPIILKNKLKISNEILLKIIRSLTTSKVNNVLQRINFLEIKEEEIGAVYESLLDYKPNFDSNNQFQLIEGTERKSTGSYYTPRSLIDILIRTTLQPLVEDRLVSAGDYKEEREKAILELKVCDPACGGGTFLLSALDFLGMKLAEVRTGSDSPLEDDLREARRDILQHCIYGVDMNQLAVELAKISLWLRACVKDKPLNFLDNHVKCGNSLIGLGQKTEISGIDPNSFKAISGNNSTGIPKENIKLQNMARKIIRDEIKEQKISTKKITTITAFMTDTRTADICSTKFQEIIDMSESDPEEIEKKEKRYEDLRKNENYLQALNEANIWTSTFFWPFEGTALVEIPRYTTIEQLRNKSVDPELLNLMEKINKIGTENQFFHWYIEFPEVFSTERGGFDCILTNPPWEELQFKKKEFFAGHDNEIINASKSSDRDRLIRELENRKPTLFRDYIEAWRNSRKLNNYLRVSKLFELSAKGTINTYALFIERCYNLLSRTGYSGIITPTGIVMNYYLRELFGTLVKNKAVLSIFDFVNKKGLFDIHRDFRFCLMSIAGKDVSQDFIPMTFYTINPADIQEPLSIIFEKKGNLMDRLEKLPNNHYLITFEPKDFELFNPNTLTCPIFSTRYDFILTKKIYENSKIILSKSDPIITNLEIHRMFNLSDDSGKFLTMEALSKFKKEINSPLRMRNDEIFLPLYESKLIWLYDHRFASFAECSVEEIQNGRPIQYPEKKSQHNFHIEPRYWIKKEFMEKKKENWNWKRNWYLAIRKVTNSSNQRTCIPCIIPNYPSSDSINLILNITPIQAAYLVSIMSSYVFDYATRQKIGATNLKQYLIEQLPIIDFELWKKNQDLILPKIIKLIFSTQDLSSFSVDCGFTESFINWNQEERKILQCKLDAIYAHLYKLNENELEYIMDTFPIIREADLVEHGSFHTKELILKFFKYYKDRVIL